MPLHFPDFRQEYLTGLSACANFHANREHSLPGGVEIATAEYTAGEIEIVVRLQIDSDDNVHFHLHLDIDTKEASRNADNAMSSIDELKSLVLPYFGEDADIYWTGKFDLERSNLPRRGMIEALLGVTTTSCGADLELNGSKFAINSDSFTEMEWEWDADTDCICATIRAETSGPVGDNYLTHGADLLKAGLDCFVLENTSEPQHAPQIRHEKQA